MNSSLITSILPVITLVLGLVLREALDWIKFRRKHGIIRKALMDEIEDIKFWAEDARETIEKMVSDISQDKVPNGLLIKIAHPVFTEHFPQVYVQLASSERIHFNAIYRLVGSINSQYERLAEVRLKYELAPPQHKEEMLSVLQDTYTSARLVSYRAAFYSDGGKELNLHKSNTQKLISQYEAEFANLYQHAANSTPRI
ncbi:MAG: hypothetical protein QOC99_2836 [Acidobacteriota bacterium]|jgi:hypothetical protein|nr:hypothetical protein [Acidobacteriota bacterium]